MLTSNILRLCMTLSARDMKSWTWCSFFPSSAVASIFQTIFRKEMFLWFFIVEWWAHIHAMNGSRIRAKWMAEMTVGNYFFSFRFFWFFAFIHTVQAYANKWTLTNNYRNWHKHIIGEPSTSPLYCEMPWKIKILWSVRARFSFSFLF